MLYDVKLTGFTSDEIIMIDLCMKVLRFDASRAYECIDNMPSVLASNVDMNSVKEIKAAFEREGAYIEVVPVEKSSNLRKNNNANNTSDSNRNDDLSKQRPYSVNNTSTTLNETDLEILNLKYNPYKNDEKGDSLLIDYSVSINDDDSMYGENTNRDYKEKRSIKFGRRSTDSNPHIYNDDEMQSEFQNTIIDKRKKDPKKNPYAGYSASSSKGYYNSLKTPKTQDNSTKQGEDIGQGYKTLRKDTHYQNYDMSAQSSIKGNYKERVKNKNEQESVYTKHEAIAKNTEYNKHNMRNAQDDGINPPYSRRLEKSKMYDVNGQGVPSIQPYSQNLDYNQLNEAKDDFSMVQNKFDNVINDNNSFRNNKIHDKTNIESNKSAYEDSLLNFTKQQHFGTIDKDKNPDDDLYDLGAIHREKSNSKKKYTKEQNMCPKCGSAFVSTKKGQSIFGTTKVKHVCEACNYKF